MKVIGLTGGIGMGKSASVELLAKRGVPVVDTDELARRLVEPGQPALQEILQAFGKEMIGPDGRLRRATLAQAVFAEKDKREKLEGILHPRIRDLWRARLLDWQREGRPLAVVVIPLLFETRAETEFDDVICVACTPEIQRQRLLNRGWTPESIEQRIAAQWPVAQKILRSNYVIWTEGDLDAHSRQLDRVLSQSSSAPSAAC